MINLSKYELELYAAIARLQCQYTINLHQYNTSNAGHNSVGAASGRDNPAAAGGGQIGLYNNGIREMTINEIFIDFDKMTDVISKKVNLICIDPHEPIEK